MIVRCAPSCCCSWWASPRTPAPLCPPPLWLPPLTPATSGSLKIVKAVSLFPGTQRLGSSLSRCTTRPRASGLSPHSASETEVRPSRQVFPEIPSGLIKIYSSVRKPAGDRQVWAETVDARSSPTSSHGKLLQNLVASSWQKWQRFRKNGNSSPKGYFFTALHITCH